MNEYNINPDFRDYVDGYCKQYGITPERAVEHCLVKAVEEECRNRRAGGGKEQIYE